MSKKNNVLSLFSGIGIMDLGFEKAGFNIVVANDIDSVALETHKYNFPNTNIINGDIMNK